METMIGQAPGGGVKEVTDQSFSNDVLEASRQKPVIAAFGPDRSSQFGQLMKVLEATIKAEGNRIILCRIDTDQNIQVASQMGLREIPAVVAFYETQPVDGFSGIRREREIAAFVRKLIVAAGPSAADTVLAGAKEAFDQGDVDHAFLSYSAYLQSNPGHPRALAGLMRCCLLRNDIAQARAALDQVPDEHRDHSAVAGARIALELAQEVAEAGDPVALAETVELRPDDVGARFDLALALINAGQQEEAAAQLLDIVRRDRDWNDSVARRKLLALFEMLGPSHPVTLASRRTLSSILFS